MNIAGREVVVPAGSIVRFPNAVMYDVRNLGTERCDKGLPLNEMMFHVRRDATLRARWRTDLEGIAREFGLGREEYEALRDKDVRCAVAPGGSLGRPGSAGV